MFVPLLPNQVNGKLMSSSFVCDRFLYLLLTYTVPSRCIGQTREAAAAAASAANSLASYQQ